MRSKPFPAVLPVATLAAALLVTMPAGASASAPAPTPGASDATAGASATTPAAQSAARIPRRAVATRRKGVRRIAGIRIGPLRQPGAIPTLADVRRKLGKPRSIRGRRTESCTARWGAGLQMDFVTFGIPGACADRALQTARIDAPRWRVRVGKRTFRIGTPRRRVARHGKRVRDWGGGYALATMPFIGDRANTVIAHLSRGRIDRFTLFVGGGGD